MSNRIWSNKFSSPPSSSRVFVRHFKWMKVKPQHDTIQKRAIEQYVHVASTVKSVDEILVCDPAFK